MDALEEAQREINRLRTAFVQIRLIARMADTSSLERMHDDLRFCHDVAHAMLTTSAPCEPSNRSTSRNGANDMKESKRVL